MTELVDQAAAIDRAHHVVIAVELTDKRNHRFCECFTVDPFTKTLVGLLSHGNLPHVGAEKKGLHYAARVTRVAMRACRAIRNNSPFKKNHTSRKPNKTAGSQPTQFFSGLRRVVRNPP